MLEREPAAIGMLLPRTAFAQSTRNPPWDKRICGNFPEVKLAGVVGIGATGSWRSLAGGRDVMNARPHSSFRGVPFASIIVALLMRDLPFIGRDAAAESQPFRIAETFAPAVALVFYAFASRVLRWNDAVFKDLSPGILVAIGLGVVDGFRLPPAVLWLVAPRIPVVMGTRSVSWIFVGASTAAFLAPEIVEAVPGIPVRARMLWALLLAVSVCLPRLLSRMRRGTPFSEAATSGTGNSG